jgi:hypothetical protein
VSSLDQLWFRRSVELFAGPQEEEFVMKGTPLLLSNDKSGLLLSRTSTRRDPAVETYEETLLQEVIDRWPDMLPIGDFLPNVSSVCSLGREIPAGLGESEGYIDNLLVTDDGHLVIVETKLWKNPEALRKVIAQTLQYGMAVTQMTLEGLEGRIRHGDPKGQRLGQDETVLQRTTKKLQEKADDFEDSFDRLRRNGDILLLIVADEIRASVERIVEWMNKFGSAPYKLGLVELGLYELDGRRMIVPKTLLRTREASRHVVTINIQGAARDSVMATVSTPDHPSEKRKIVAAAPPLTEQGLAAEIRTKNPPDTVRVAEMLLSRLKESGLGTRGLPSTFQFGIDVGGNFTPLVSMSSREIWFQLPMRAVRALGGERFVACKQTINSVANFYRPEDVSDDTKTNALTPKYSILTDKVEEFVEVVARIAQMVRSAVAETEGK